MIVRSYLLGVGLATALTLIAWLLILFYFDPNSSGTVGLILFFLSLAVLLSGLLTLVFYVIRRYFSEDRLAVFTVALRHGVILGLIVALAVLFKGLGVFAWWNVGTVVLIGVVLEIYFQVK